ncbi:type II secretion system minor pseudopilin GspK [Parathalassolituus penaei]|uniref:Type II secretion system protein K n=1 Tax=Parathalassolituus penaei TaxID=2997323 RepID=A0A9X3ED97_9GAMM|nr:type II secretion system minor pseudopilin GspK [Parathalassolituus penaei]MCY0965492.1 type II secretion system minor pseudopilin GspK [Parathalassolituus penaei]
MRRQQSGLALLMVLLFFALASVIATSIIEQQSMNIQRTTGQLATQQARAFAWGVESVVRSGLYLDWEDNPDIDHYMEQWTIDRSFPMEQGTVFVHIVDAQGLFNLNWLAPAASNHKVWQARFQRLLKNLGGNVEFAETLANWMNSESQADDLYSRLEVPYRAAYRICSDISEVRLLDGMDEDTWVKLEPYITCLPASTQLNVNTALDQVLAALDDDFGLDGAMAVIGERGEDGIASVDDFWNIAEVANAASGKKSSSTTTSSSSSSSDSSASDDSSSSDSSDDDSRTTNVRWSQDDFTVKTSYFLVFTRVDIGTEGDWLATSQFMLRRQADDGSMSIISRDYSRREAIQLPAPAASSSF